MGRDLRPVRPKAGQLDTEIIYPGSGPDEPCVANKLAEKVGDGVEDHLRVDRNLASSS